MVALTALHEVKIHADQGQLQAAGYALRRDVAQESL
jgi:hypothetical protein